MSTSFINLFELNASCLYLVVESLQKECCQRSVSWCFRQCLYVASSVENRCVALLKHRCPLWSCNVFLGTLEQVNVKIE